MDARALITPARMASTLIPGFAFPPHVQAFQRHVMRLFSDSNYNRLIVECMVRAGKSYWFTYVLPCWVLMTMPGKNIIVVAHNEDLAGDFISRIRDFMRAHGKLVGRSLDPDQQSKHHLRILGAGAPSDIWGFGREGALRGRGAHLIIADDLLRDSDTLTGPTLPKINSWWFNALTRTEPGAKICIVMSRVAPNDLSGFCLEQNAHLESCDQWHSVKFPALDANGMALWPERYSAEWLKRKRLEFENAGEGWLFDAQYMQDAYANPKLIEWPSSYFDGIFYPDDQPILVRNTFAACDLAQGRSESGDFSCIVRMAEDSDGAFWVTDSLLLRCPIPEFEERAAAFLAEHPSDAFLCETNVESGALTHIAEIAQSRYNCNVYPNAVHHTEPKDVRLRKFISTPLHQHALRFRDTPSNKLIVQQMREFPSGVHDDGPDAVAMAIELKKAFNGEPV